MWLPPDAAWHAKAVRREADRLEIVRLGVPRAAPCRGGR